MQVSDDDRLGEAQQPQTRTSRWLIPALICGLLVAAGGGYWLYQHYLVGQPPAPVDTGRAARRRHPVVAG